MNLPIDKDKEIKDLATKISKAYQRYADLSSDIEEMMQPYIDSAIKNKNTALLNELIHLTSPCDKNGQPLRGDYLGRIYLYMALNEIKSKKK